MNAAAPWVAPGTVGTYTPDPTRHSPHWCREGMAIADKSGRLLDTFWESGSEAHVLDYPESQTLTVLFNLDDYEPIGPECEWLKYREEDRQLVTSQHRLSKRYYVRKGSEPDLETQISNASAALQDAHVALASAGREVAWKARELARLEALR